jgi:hypothetical protein
MAGGQGGDVMRIVRTVSLWTLCIAVVLPGVPGLAAAQNAVLYEVSEAMKVRKGKSTGKREAVATLMGTISAGTALCPAPLAQAFGAAWCHVVARAGDSLDLTTGKGPVGGKFAIIIHGDNPVDPPELVIATGYIGGRIDLSPALLNGVPTGTLTGSWRAEGEDNGPLAGLRLEGSVTGVFRLPFVYGMPQGCLDDGDPSDCVYVSKPSYWTDHGPAELGYHEYSLAVPAVKLELTFTESQPSKKKK